MKVAFDISPLKSTHQFRGIGRYTQDLMAALNKYSTADFQIELIKQGRIPHDVDVVHYPYFDLFRPTLPLKKPKKTVVTIHDVIPLVFPRHFRPGIRGRLRFYRQKLSLRGVKGVICDSKNSQRDIVKYLGFPQEKIEVVYLAPSQEFRPIKRIEKNRLTKKYQLPAQFILYVGDVNWHKNIAGLLKAFKQMQKKDLGLVLVGKALENRNLKETRLLLQLIKELEIEPQVKILGFVPDEDLVSIYNLAIVYCQPSFYEGFGLPVLEAMACGTVVVASNQASLPEICGQAAIMIDPSDLADLARGLMLAIEDKGLREKLIEKGLKQAQKFTWGKTAQETIKIYQQVNEEKQ